VNLGGNVSKGCRHQLGRPCLCSVRLLRRYLPQNIREPLRYRLSANLSSIDLARIGLKVSSLFNEGGSKSCRA
jgi:hypothetical protein